MSESASDIIITQHKNGVWTYRYGNAFGNAGESPREAVELAFDFLIREVGLDIARTTNAQMYPWNGTHYTAKGMKLTLDEEVDAILDDKQPQYLKTESGLEVKGHLHWTGEEPDNTPEARALRSALRLQAKMLSLKLSDLMDERYNREGLTKKRRHRLEYKISEIMSALWMIDRLSPIMSLVNDGGVESVRWTSTMNPDGTWSEPVRCDEGK